MKDIAQRSRLLLALLGAACATAPLASCTNDVGGGTVGGGTIGQASPDAPTENDLDPTGNWNVTYMFGAGCGQPATTASSTFTVTRAATGYAVAAAGATVMGTLICTPESCKLSGSFAWAASGSQFEQDANITLDAQGNITGNGTEAVVTMSTTCAFTFTVQGTRT